eukprot:Skav229235  [mRNA]  locus=scaffold2154:9804:10602:+ [translate_table: standard]
MLNSLAHLKRQDSVATCIATWIAECIAECIATCTAKCLLRALRSALLIAKCIQDAPRHIECGDQSYQNSLSMLPDRIEMSMYVYVDSRKQMLNTLTYCEPREENLVSSTLDRVFAWACAHGADAIVMPPFACMGGLLHPRHDTNETKLREQHLESHVRMPTMQRRCNGNAMIHRILRAPCAMTGYILLGLSTRPQHRTSVNALPVAAVRSRGCMRGTFQWFALRLSIQRTARPD